MRTILLDNGHGRQTPGKRSPIWSDGTQMFEYEFNRDIVKRITAKLSLLKIQYKIIVPELNDILLDERVRRINAIYKSDRTAVLLSVHSNAGGGQGWECYTTVGNTKSDPIATILCQEAKKALPSFKMRFEMSDADPDKESQFYIIKNTNCPAVLTENLFMDNEQECKFLMSNTGRDIIAALHVAAIKRIVLT